MYYEEKIIDGVLMWRGSPDGEWQPVKGVAEQYLAQKEVIGELERQAHQLRYLNDSQAATIRATQAGRPDCRWHYTGDYLWDTRCGAKFEIDDPAGAEPYCPRCGGRAVLTQEDGGAR